MTLATDPSLPNWRHKIYGRSRTLFTFAVTGNKTFKTVKKLGSIGDRMSTASIIKNYFY